MAEKNVFKPDAATKSQIKNGRGRMFTIQTPTHRITYEETEPGVLVQRLNIKWQ